MSLFFEKYKSVFVNIFLYIGCFDLGIKIYAEKQTLIFTHGSEIYIGNMLLLLSMPQLLQDRIL